MRFAKEQVLARLRAWVSGPPGSAPVEQAAMIGLVAVGLFFRSRGMLFGDTLELWNDESSWAMRVFERPLSEHKIRPPAYVIFSRLSALMLDKTELGFRLLPWLAGMATPFVAVWLARRFLQNAAARVLFVAVLCLSLHAIDFSKEFKQYSIGLLIHLLLPLLALRWIQTRAARDLIVVCVAAPLALMFSQDVMFLYPGLFLVLALEAYRAKDRRQLLIACGAGAATVALVLSMFFLVWTRIKKDQAEQHWGGRYDVFYLAAGTQGATKESRLEWLAGKYADMAAMPGARRSYWDHDVLSKSQRAHVANVDYGLWVLLHAAGVLTLLWTRRFREALLFWSPVLVLMVVNALGRWPIGPFRTNLFLFAGMTATACVAFEWFRPVQAKLASLTPALLLVVAPLVVFERHWHSQKPGAYAVAVLSMLEELQRKRANDTGGKQRLYMDGHSCSPFNYYTKYHPKGRRVWQELEPKTIAICGDKRKPLLTAASKLPKNEQVWFLFVQKEALPKALKPLSRSRKQLSILTQARVR
jgi:hypothetical protein